MLVAYLYDPYNDHSNCVNEKTYTQLKEGRIYDATKHLRYLLYSVFV
jgi:hypothetical protein